MCILQTVYAKDIFPESGVKKATVQSVVENFEGIEGVNYSESVFHEMFTESKVEFSKLVKYARTSLCSPWLSLPLFIEKIEVKCWEMCRRTYTTMGIELSVKADEICKLWCVFSRLCDEGTYPPTISHEASTFLVERIAKSLSKSWGSSSSVFGMDMKFKDLLEYLDKSYFSISQPEAVKQSIDEIYSWLVKEVMKTGWLWKRTRKNANWTNWLKRWFVMTPGIITYFDSDKSNEKIRGSVVIYQSTTLEKLDDYKSIITRKNRFKVSNKPALEIELSADSASEKDAWFNLIQQNIQVVKEGTTPRMKLFKDRANYEGKSKKDALTEADEKLDKFNVEVPVAVKPGDRKSPDKKSADEEEIFDNNLAEIEADKIRTIFLKIDKDGNGRIDNNEFVEFLCGLGARVSPQEATIIFQAIDKNKDKTICYEEFVDYFLKFVMVKTNESDVETKLRKAFLEADRDRSGAVNFREFSEYVYSKRRTIAMEKLMSSFDKLDQTGKGEINFDDFKEFFKNEPIFKDIESTNRFSTSIEGLIKKTYDETDVESIAELLKSRWNKFASFKRYGAEGDLVMTGGHGIVSDVVPGNYSLVDLACFNDLPPIEPKSVKIEGVLWNSSTIPGRSGRVFFPADFDGVIPTEIATNETLAFYGASLATGNQVKVSLLYRHGIQDFTYENNYLEQYVTAENALGGAGIEKHDFAHLDCPFEHDSGFFILGKMEKDVLHLTAFKVPTRHTIYVPQGVIHSNDYLKGTWRTMLSDEANIDHVQLVKMHRKGNREELEHFTFSFPALV